MDHGHADRRHLLYTACHRLPGHCWRSRAEEARHRSRYAGRDAPPGRQLADQFRREIPNSRGDPTTAEAEPTRDPIDHAAAECFLDLWPRERRSIGLAEP